MSPRRYVGDDLDHADAGTENGRHIEFAGSTVWREVDFQFCDSMGVGGGVAIDEELSGGNHIDCLITVAGIRYFQLPTDEGRAR